MDYIGVKINKPLDSESSIEYAKIAEWCNEQQKGTIQDRGEYYECVAFTDPTFEHQIIAKLSELEESFDERVAGSFESSLGWPMQFNRSDTLAVEGAIQLLRATGQTEGYLTDAEDVTHYDVPLSTMETVKVEMLAAYAACHARKQELRAAINAAQTEEELDAIEITWPV